MRARFSWPWVGVALLLAIVACEREGLAPRFYRADFEQVCDGVPCGWERTSGDPSQATWIETIHPGERGLRLEGEVNLRGPGASADQVWAPDLLSALLTARCDLGSQLHVDVVMADETGASFSATATFNPAAEWRNPIETSLTIVSEPRANAARVIAVGISKTGLGVCEISELIIDVAPVWRDPGC